MKRWLNTALIVLFSCVFLISAFYLGSYFLKSRQNQSRYDDLAALVQQNIAPAPEASVPSGELDDAPATEPSALVEVTHPVTGESVTVLRQYAQLYQMNPDLAGWLKIEGTPVNYPVMQTPDEPDYYLKRSFDKEYSEHGCLYAREACDLNAPSDNITIYGHHMRDGSMFGSLSKYKDQSYYQAHSTLTFDTLTQTHTYEILSVFLTTASEGEGFHYHLFSDASDEAHYNEFVDTCKALSLYETGVDAVYGDRLITLSTCDYSQTNGRLVLVAKRVS